ncbi:hypothetical protein ACFWIY_34120 [Streptomyces sioyaensis]|uniref:hypothetical protein n=1 Tax=Streptomyces sioyaensis TaxID=67364 RepID=UPI0036481118
MTFHTGDHAYELLARSHHHSTTHKSTSHVSHYSTGHHTPGVSFGGWWMIVVGAVIAFIWVFAKRKFGSR